MAENLTEENVEQVATSTANALAQSAYIMASQGDSAWTEQFSQGQLEPVKIIPIYSLNDVLSQTMVIFNEGYIVTDANTGELVRYSYEPIDIAYFESIDKLYTDGLSFYGTDSSGKILDGNTKDGTSDNEAANIEEIKDAVESGTTTDPSIDSTSEVPDETLLNQYIDEPTTNPITDESANPLTDENVEDILNSDFYAANEGTGVANYITDPKLWLLRYYPNREKGITNLAVSQVENYSKSDAEINQGDSDYYEANDCALVATLEILNYHYGSQSSANRIKAYKAMVNSSYFSKSNGVQWYHNDDLFKVAAQAIGKGTQSTSNDPGWKLGASYNEYKSYINSYGPSYLSINCDPYGAHTVTVKGYAKFKTTYRDRFYINRTFYDDFIRINDHWGITSGDAYLYLDRTASDFWYMQGIKPD